MKLGEAAKLFAAGAAFKAGSGAAGRVLINGLASTDENNRQIAGMLLVQAGERSVPLLERELSDPRNLPLLLQIMGDVSPERFRATLQRYAEDRDPIVSRAAKAALKAGRT